MDKRELIVAPFIYDKWNYQKYTVIKIPQAGIGYRKISPSKALNDKPEGTSQSKVD